jgi:hypothetical protein
MLQTLVKRIDQLSAALGYDTGLIDTMQRFELPFNFAKGTAHANLNSSGSFAVSTLLGLQIDITASPAGTVLEGNPAYIWNLGWVSITDQGGMLQEQRVSQMHRLWFPTHMQLATLVGYWFYPSITATITELTPLHEVLPQ